MALLPRYGQLILVALHHRIHRRGEIYSDQKANGSCRHSTNDNTGWSPNYDGYLETTGGVADVAWRGWFTWVGGVDRELLALVWKLYRSKFIRDQSVKPVAAASLI